MDRLDQLESARVRARGVRVVKLAGQDRYLARSRTYEPGGYFELWVSPWGHVRCTCPGFTYRGICKHAEALKIRLHKTAQSAPTVEHPDPLPRRSS